MMRRIFCAVLSIAVLTAVCAAAPVKARASDSAAAAPDLAAYTACLMDAETGDIIYDKNAAMQQYPASMTKVMTALLVIENTQLSDTVTVSARAATVGGSGIDTKEGEQFTVEQLLYAMMLPSANDAATALGEYTGGSVEGFADMMNERANGIGAYNTHFANACGLHDDNHYTTAKDMALIMQEAIKNETFRTIIGTVSYRIPATNMTQFTRELTNTNRMLYDTSPVMVNGAERQYLYDGILGGKTGYTYEAERCLVTYAQRNGVTLIGVEMHSTYEYQFPDMISLLDYGFANFVKVMLIKAGDVLGQARVTKGEKGEVPVTVTEDIYGLAEKGSDAKISDKYSYTLTTNSINAPVSSGDNAGSLTLFKDTTQLDTYDLVATEDIELSVFEKFREMLGSQSPVAFVLLICFLFICVVIYSSITRFARNSNNKAMKRNRRHRDILVKDIMDKDYNFLEVHSGTQNTNTAQVYPDISEISEASDDTDPVSPSGDIRYENSIAYDLMDDIMTEKDTFGNLSEDERIAEIIRNVKKM